MTFCQVGYSLSYCEKELFYPYKIESVSSEKKNYMVEKLDQFA